MAGALAGLRAYQEAERPLPPVPPSPVAELLGAALRDYGGAGAPVVFIPSLINPPTVLDLAERSLLRWLASEGHRPLLLDWGWEVEARRDLGVAGHVEEIAVPLIRSLGEPAALVGYCLGGTMALAAARPADARCVATIAAPWRFSGFGDEARARLAGLWGQARGTADAMGLLPMEILQTAFWSLDPARTVAKFEAFAAMAPGSPAARAFVALEDWANDGPPLPAAAACEMFEDLFAADAPGCGTWKVSGEAVDPTTLTSPLLNIVSTVDRIVPAATAPTAGDRLELARGHVGMVVGGSAREALWEPLSDWLFRSAASC